MAESIVVDKMANNMNPVCAIVENANKRLTRFWYNADIEPTNIDAIQEKSIIVVQISERKNDENNSNLSIITNNIIFGNAAKSKVIDRIEPS